MKIIAANNGHDIASHVEHKDGAILNAHCRFYRKDIGQSVTLTGRQIVKHMMSKINEIVEGDYSHEGRAIVYGDSVAGSSLISTNLGEKTIEDLFNWLPNKWELRGKEFASHDILRVKTYNPENNVQYYEHINFVCRHKVNKEKWIVESVDGHFLELTEDHGLMIKRNEEFLEIKPADVLVDSDLLIVSESEQAVTKQIKHVTNVGTWDEDWVYDVSVLGDHHYFFANDILAKNTDSAYFTAHPALEEQIKNNEVDWSKDTCISLYDNIADQTNESWPAFMEQTFNCPRKNGKIIKAGRELIGDRGIFITKKRYAINIFDKEGNRKDINGKAGSIKAMGLDLKRADTPKFVQEFLMDVLSMVIQQGKTKGEVIEKIKEFKREFAEMDPWIMGTPKAVNNLTRHTQEYEKTGQCKIGHAKAAIHYNYLRRLNNDTYSQQIVDGTKIVVCKLRPNPLGFTSIAWPIDETRLPDWFKELPFDTQLMEETLIDKKIENLLGVLGWNLDEHTDTNSTFDDLFDFG